ncbi:hypothetical protein C0J52_22501 [Blattella germanica]|nr:hypothetical protein C0J52_22501 [Blattella germanica]
MKLALWRWRFVALDAVRGSRAYAKRFMMAEEITIETDSDDDIQICEVIEKKKPETWLPFKKPQIKDYVNSFEEGEEKMKKDILEWMFFEGDWELRDNDASGSGEPQTKKSEKEASDAEKSDTIYFCFACSCTYNDAKSFSNHDCPKSKSNAHTSHTGKESGSSKVTSSVSKEATKTIAPNKSSEMHSASHSDKPHNSTAKSNLFCFLCEMLFSNRELLASHDCIGENPNSNKLCIKEEPVRESVDDGQSIQGTETRVIEQAIIDDAESLQPFTTGGMLQPMEAIEALQPIELAESVQLIATAESSHPIDDMEVSPPTATGESALLNHEQALQVGDWESGEMATVSDKVSEKFQDGMAPVIADTVFFSQNDGMRSGYSTEETNVGHSRISESLTDTSNPCISKGSTLYEDDNEKGSKEVSASYIKAPFICFICGYFFNRQGSYEQHKLKCIRHPNSEDSYVNHTYICVTCENIFTNEDKYKIHSKNCKSKFAGDHVRKRSNKSDDSSNSICPPKVLVTALPQNGIEENILKRDSSDQSKTSHTPGSLVVINYTRDLPPQDINDKQQCNETLSGIASKDLEKSKITVGIRNSSCEVYNINRRYSCVDCQRTFILKKSLDAHTCFTSPELSSPVKK